MATLIPVESAEAILPQYRTTPIEALLRYHNLGEPLPPTTIKAHMLIGTCMDHREDFRVPNEFAYMIRTAGGNVIGHEFAISYAIAVGGVATIALFAHTDCGMSQVTKKREAFIAGLTARAGSSEAEASRQFEKYASAYEIGESVSFVLSEVARLKPLYPKILIAPLLYQVENDCIVQILE